MTYAPTTSLALSKRIVAAIEKRGGTVPETEFYWCKGGYPAHESQRNYSDWICPAFQLHEIFGALVGATRTDISFVYYPDMGWRIGQAVDNPDPTEAAGTLWAEVEEAR